MTSEVAVSPTGWPFRLLSLALLFGAGVLLLSLPSPGLAMGVLVLLTFAVLVVRGRLFSVEGYLCIAAGYYWLGIANPFGADVHQAAFARSVMPTVTWLVVLGLSLIYAGALAGRRLAGGQEQMEWKDPKLTGSLESTVKRLHRCSYAFLTAGVAMALASYVRLGIPALAANSDLARTEFMGRLSPFTFYQWLNIEVGIGLAALAYANDRQPERTRAKLRLALAAAASVLVVVGVYSRVSIGTPLVIAAVVWWSQGRRIPPAVALVGIAAAVLVVSLVWVTRIQSLGTFELYGVTFDFNAGPLAAAKAIAAALSIFARTSVETFGMFVAGTLHKLHGEIAFMSLISLLPGHHPGLGLFRVSQMLGYDPQSGTTVSLIGGMYADWGVGGILIAAPTVGLLLGYLERRARSGDRLVGIYYGIAVAYFLNMIYGGQLLDVTLLWKLWLATIAVRYCRYGTSTGTHWGAAQFAGTVGLYGYGVLLLLSA